jgi:hypothetical protein
VNVLTGLNLLVLVRNPVQFFAHRSLSTPAGVESRPAPSRRRRGCDAFHEKAVNRKLKFTSTRISEGVVVHGVGVDSYFGISPRSPGGREGRSPRTGVWGRTRSRSSGRPLGGVRGGSPALVPETVDSGFHPHSCRRRLGRISWRGACIDPVFP